jgi:nitronate monooxygenase/enoyl-[acyl-carrier protein] reductase II
MTNLQRVLGIETPILLAPFGPWEQVDLAAAVCQAGGLGQLGTALKPLAELRLQWARLRELTDRPFAINHTVRPFDEDAFAATLAFRPAAVSFHLGIAPELVARTHDVGVLWIQQVMSRAQAEEALAAGADVLIAQGGEAGGNSGWVSSMVLVPQIVDMAGDTPVVAAGGIADGRGVAAAFALGAAGVCLGTRFLASTEMGISPEWKQRIIDADALDAVKVAHSELVLPPANLPAWPAQPRALRTPLIDQLEHDPDAVDPVELRTQLVTALQEDRGHQLLPFTGQSAGLITDVVPAADIIRRIFSEATQALSSAYARLEQRGAAWQ